MHSFATMADRHAFGLEALAEMTGKLVQATYERAIHPRDPDDQDRAILLFDRLARCFRLTLAQEAREARARRRDEAAEPAPTAARETSPARPSAPRDPRDPREADCEDEADVEIIDLPGHIRGLRRLVAENPDILDPDGETARTLDRWAGAWGDVLTEPPLTSPAKRREGDRAPSEAKSAGWRGQATPHLPCHPGFANGEDRDPLRSASSRKAASCNAPRIHDLTARSLLGPGSPLRSVRDDTEFEAQSLRLAPSTIGSPADGPPPAAPRGRKEPPLPLAEEGRVRGVSEARSSTEAQPAPSG